MEKTKYDRVKETVHLLKSLQSNGISDSNDGYLKTKECMDEWIKTGVAAEHVIEFYTYRRKGFLTLPNTADKAAEMVLKITKS
jgi:uncharacterized protein YjgD (DUF1641 family)